jgi:hypothetical protein
MNQGNRMKVRSREQGVSGHGFSRAADRPSLRFSPSVRVFALRKPGPKAKCGLYGFVFGTTEVVPFYEAHEFNILRGALFFLYRSECSCVCRA